VKTIPVTREKLDVLYFTSETFLNKYCPDNTEQIEQMKKVIKKIIKEELTDRQKEIIQMYYFKGMTLDKIAQKIGLAKCSVSLTKKRAIEKIKKSEKVAELLQCG